MIAIPVCMTSSTGLCLSVYSFGSGGLTAPFHETAPGALSLRLNTAVPLVTNSLSPLETPKTTVDKLPSDGFLRIK